MRPAEKKNHHTGFAIAVAWPATYCKQPGSWYDPLMVRLGISKNHYYRVGHAAVVLVNPENLVCHYYDFGRYHAPFNHGRVRNAETDHDLEIKTKPVLSEDGSRIENQIEILEELQANRSCHGDGDLYASWCRVDLQAALSKARQLQDISPIPYGPFIRKGNNCSRFVSAVIRTGKPLWKLSLRMKYLVVLTPTPMSIVNSLPGKTVIRAELRRDVFYPHEKPGIDALKSTLKAPERKPSVPENAQWLSGEGAGSWFVFAPRDSNLEVTRYSPGGDVECIGIFAGSEKGEIIPDKSWIITHPSNCRVVTLKNGVLEMKYMRVPV